MAQVIDRTVGANPTGFDMRTELNNIIAALESDNSGSSEPLNTVPYMKWMDTSNATYYYVKERNHDNTAWVTLFRYTVATKIMEAVSNNVVLSHVDIASDIHIATSKTTPLDADEIGLVDSASTFTLKKLTWANLKDTLKTYFDTLYVTLSGNQTIEGVKTFSSSPIVPTQTAGDNSTKVATTAFIKTEIDNTINPLKDVPQNAQTAAYTLALTDRGKSIDVSTGGITITVPLNSAVTFPIGATVTITNLAATAITIASSATLRQAGTANTGNRTLAAYGMATLRKVASDTWFISGAGLS